MQTLPYLVGTALYYFFGDKLTSDSSESPDSSDRENIIYFKLSTGKVYGNLTVKEPRHNIIVEPAFPLISIGFVTTILLTLYFVLSSN